MYHKPWTYTPQQRSFIHCSTKPNTHIHTHTHEKCVVKMKSKIEIEIENENGEKVHLIFACALWSFRWRFFNPFSSTLSDSFSPSSVFVFLISSDYFTVLSPTSFSLFFCACMCVSVISVVILKFIFRHRFIILNNNICCNCILYPILLLAASLSRSGLCILLFSFIFVYNYSIKKKSFQYSSFFFDRFINVSLKINAKRERERNQIQIQTQQIEKWRLSTWNECTSMHLYDILCHGD